jgi:hypothetical protein
VRGGEIHSLASNLQEIRKDLTFPVDDIIIGLADNFILFFVPLKKHCKKGV